MRYFDFNGNQLSQVFKGNWQLAGGHGKVDHDAAIADLFVYADKGVNTFDMGDIYTGVEELLGDFRAEYHKTKGESADRLFMHTKFVPDRDALEDLTKDDIRAVIVRSCKRLGVDSLDLVQFHWWDYDKGDFVEAARFLDELRQEGLIKAIGLTNFDCEHTQMLLDAGVPIVSNQIQFSLLDSRPLNGMLELAQKNDIHIFCYGVLAGGLLSGSSYDATNRSHIKYNLMIEEVGQTYFDETLEIIERLAEKYHTTKATIAMQFALQTPGVSSVIVGPRNAEHCRELDDIDTVHLTAEEYDKLFARLEKTRRPDQDIYSYEREKQGKHAVIMQYNNSGLRSKS